MKKKSLLFILVVFICFILFGCKEEASNSHRRHFTLWLDSSDGTGIYPYGPTPTNGIYVLKEHQSYKLWLQTNGPWELFPESIVMEYDDTIFEIVCLTTPESEEYGCNVFYHLTCLKTCETTSFIIPQIAYHTDIDDPCCYKFTFSVE